MKIQFYFSIYFAALLVSCEKPTEQQADESPAENLRVRVIRPDKPTAHEATPTPVQDSHRFLAAAEKLPTQEARDQALAQVAWNAMELAPEVAASAFKQMSSDSPERQPLINWYATQLVEKDLEEAITWANALRSDVEKASAKQEIAMVLAETDPKRAIEQLAGERSAAPAEMDGTTQHVLHRWVAVSPLAAATWAAAFPSGDARTTAIKSVVTDWTQADPKAVFSWLETLNSKPIFKEASESLIEAFADQPDSVRESWLEHASPRFRAGLERQHQELLQQEEVQILPPME